MTRQKFDYGFVVPLVEEAVFFIENLHNVKKIIDKKREIICGNFRDYKISLIISGCGKIKSASATQLLIDKFPAKSYIHFGTAGAISPKLKIKDIIIATEVIEYDVEELFPKKKSPPNYKIDRTLLKNISNKLGGRVFFGPILSGDKDVVKTKIRDRLFNKYQALSVDWESSGFILTCNLNQVDGVVFRVISDYAYENTFKEYEINHKKVVKTLTKTILKLLTL